MKKLVLLTFAIFIGFNIYSQNIGVKGGLNISWLKFDERSRDDMKALNIDRKALYGYHFGIVLDRQIVSPIGVRLEVLYSQKGFKTFLKTSTEEEEVKTTLTYVEIPLLAKLKFGVIYFTAGPYLGYTASGDVATTNTIIASGVSTTEHVKKDFENDMKRFDFGLNGGIGVQLGTTGIKLFIETKFSIGLTNLYKKPIDYESQKNRTIGISAGILFGK